MHGKAGPQVEYSYDPESRNWGFRVEQPRVIGGGDRTRVAAKHHAARAIAFALRGERAERRALRARVTPTRSHRAG